MNAYQNAGFTSSGSVSKSFNASRLKTLIANRNNRFHLDLSNHTLIGVLKAYASFKRRSSPQFKNNSVINAILHLQDALMLEMGPELMPIDVTDIFYEEFKLFCYQGKVHVEETLSHQPFRITLITSALHSHGVQCTNARFLKHSSVTKLNHTNL